MCTSSMCFLAVSCTYILHSGHSTLHSPISYPPLLSWCPPHLSLEAPPPQTGSSCLTQVGLQFLLRSDSPASVNPVIISATFTQEYRHLLPGLALEKKNRASLPPCFMYVCVYTCTCVLFVCARVCLSALCNLFNGYHSTPDLEYSFLKVW